MILNGVAVLMTYLFLKAAQIVFEMIPSVMQRPLN